MYNIKILEKVNGRYWNATLIGILLLK